MVGKGRDGEISEAVDMEKYQACVGGEVRGGVEGRLGG